MQVVTQVLAASAGALVSGGLLAWSLRRDPRSLRNGLLVVVFVHYVVGLVAWVAATSSKLQTVLDVVSTVLVVAVALGLLALPVLLVAAGVLMASRERRSLGNALSLLVGVGMLVLPLVLVSLVRHENQVTGSLAVALLATQACVGAAFLVFAVHSALYSRISRRAHARAVIVLGSGLVRGEVSPLLAARLTRAVSAAEERNGPDGRPVLVTSGGQGPDEPRPEGQAMADWLLRNGTPPEDVLVEDRSRTTRENLLFSERLLEEHGVPPPYLIVTNGYHAPRAAMLARQLGVDAQAIGAPTALYYWPSAYLREFAAVMLEHRAVLVLAGVGVAALTVLTWLSLTAR